MTTRNPPCFDLWICEGRMCTAHGAEAVKDRALEVTEELPPRDRDRLRLLRGGCFGLCEMGANVIVRRFSSKGRLPDPSVDRLRVTGRANEVVYSKMSPDDVAPLVRSHLEDDVPLEPMTLREREADVPAESATARNIRRLRRSWGG